MDINFENLLGQYEQSYQEAEEYGSDWLPDDGEGYVGTIIKVSSGVKDDKPWWKVMGRLEAVNDSALDGREFPVGFYSVKNPGILKSFAKILNHGGKVATLVEAAKLVSASTGTVFQFDVKTNAKGYQNCYPKQILGDVVPPEEETQTEEAVEA